MKTMIEKLEVAFNKGTTFTAKQAMQRFGFASPESFRSAVAKLRNVKNLDIDTVKTVNKGQTMFKYSLARKRTK